MRSLLLILSLSCAFAAEWSKSYQVGRSADLDVRCDDAAVEINGGAPGRIEATVITRGWEIRPGEVEIIESQSGDRVSIQVKLPRRFGITWSNNRSVKLTVSVPSQLIARIHTGDGSIRATSVSGDLRFDTGDGSIGGSGLGGSLEAHTGDGSIHVEGKFDVLRLNTGDGSVDVTAATGSVVKSGWTVETGDGSVHIRVASDLRADLDARTGDGRVSVTGTDVRIAGSRDQQISARLGGGGLPFRVRTGDGSITIGVAR
jgi:hypothetical protein